MSEIELQRFNTRIYDGVKTVVFKVVMLKIKDLQVACQIVNKTSLFIYQVEKIVLKFKPVLLSTSSTNSKA